ncbi:TetR/AcrR family transcriptional regulator [Nocardioides caldifontis]|uniref:TetR/AcrR family transcriptional regulator n=1 Tax=Nocardioides caldifontis TaxID=2588938 RepID=UPI0011DF9226|nr:TetR/AcrR family transcriptional regulator [Nocardioides caldifontis]
MTAARRSGASRERILEAAAEVVSEHGYAGTTIARITERCGLPASSVYWFFEDKDELLAAVVLHHYEGWLERRPQWRPVGPGEDLVAVLDELLRPWFRDLGEATAYLRLGQSLLLEPREHDSAARTRFVALRREGMQVFEEWFATELRRSGAAGERPPEEVAAELARLLVVATDGLVLSHRAGEGLDSDLFLDLLLDTVAEVLQGAADRPAGTAGDRTDRMGR